MAKDVGSLQSKRPADRPARAADIVEGIKLGLADMKAGRVIPHNEAIRRLRSTLAKVAKTKT